MKKIVGLLCCLLLFAGMGSTAFAAEISGGEAYCFSPADFSSEENPVTGICITRLPEASQGTVLLGDRVLRPGDVLTAEQLGRMSFVSNHTGEDCTAAIGYLPVFAGGLAGETTMTLSIRGKENQAPIAQDCAFETYKNLELTGQLKVRDPEGQEMTFTLTRPPKRGTVEIGSDGSFTYTPKKNKVGVDSFVFTAADPAGKVSRETTVTVSILKPTDARQYQDTVGKSCRFAAEWMKNTGIFVGEALDGSPCFSPEKAVTRGEFVTMLVKALEIPTDVDLTETGYTDVPDWLKPYLAAAVRSGLTGSFDGEAFHPEQPVTSQQAASMLCAALKLEPLEQPALSAQNVLTPEEIVTQNGFPLPGSPLLTRADCAELLYQASQLN